MITHIKTSISIFLLLFVTSFSCYETYAQDIHFTQFNGSPLTLNPALTGVFNNGMWRVTGIYRNQWSSVTSPYVTFGGSFDAPLFKDVAVDDYLAAGLHVYNDRSGDGNLANLSLLGSLAYHKFMGTDANKAVSVGLQAGYTQKTIDLARLYWGDEFFNGGFQPGTTGEQVNPKVKYFTANLGIGWQHQTGERFGYQLGVAAHNVNQPKETFLRKANNEVGLAMRISAHLGAIWWANTRLSIRPAVLYQTQATASEIIAGSEFNYILGNDEIKSVASAVFIGGWYRPGDAAMATVGFETKGFRVGFAYDYNTSPLNTVSHGNGGFEITVRYVKPNPLDFARRVMFPCARF